MNQLMAMLVSIAVEAVVAAAAIQLLRWGSAWRAAVSATLGTLVTHWPAWHIAPWLSGAVGDLAGFVATETAVTVIEAMLYGFIVPLRAGRALSLSLIANGSSAALGVMLAALGLLGPS